MCVRQLVEHPNTGWWNFAHTFWHESFYSIFLELIDLDICLFAFRTFIERPRRIQPSNFMKSHQLLLSFSAVIENDRNIKYQICNSRENGNIFFWEENCPYLTRVWTYLPDYRLLGKSSWTGFQKLYNLFSIKYQMCNSVSDR